jgi:hypothetical protein
MITNGRALAVALPLLVLNALALSDILSGESALWHEWAVIILSLAAFTLLLIDYRRRAETAFKR